MVVVFGTKTILALGYTLFFRGPNQTPQPQITNPLLPANTNPNPGRKHPDVRYAEPNYKIYLDAMGPNERRCFWLESSVFGKILKKASTIRLSEATLLWIWWQIA